MAAGHGGQILASQATASVLGDDDLHGASLRDLGKHKLKDLPRPERIFELQVDGLPAKHPPVEDRGLGGAAALPPPARRVVNLRRGSTVRVRQRLIWNQEAAEKWLFVAATDTVEHLLVKEGVGSRRGCASPPKMASSRGLRPHAVRAASSGDRFWGQNRRPPCLVRQPRCARPRCRRR
jgi:hypothetical protein